MTDDPKTSDLSQGGSGEQAEQAGEQMQPPGEDSGTHEADDHLKRIDEDVEGDEETEGFFDVEAGDSPGV
jgi:hypothetical protein